MTKKNKSETKTKKAPPKKRDNEALQALFAGLRAVTSREIDPRRELLAKVAGSVAAGLAASPSPSIATADAMARTAVDIAEEILKKVGIQLTEISAATSPTGTVGTVGVEAAS